MATSWSGLNLTSVIANSVARAAFEIGHVSSVLHAQPLTSVIGHVRSVLHAQPLIWRRAGGDTVCLDLVLMVLCQESARWRIHIL